jgi:hypothetical protein
MKNSKQRFLDRINSRIFRDDNECDCEWCKDVLDNGMVIFNETHAECIYDAQEDYGIAGIILNYRDIK